MERSKTTKKISNVAYVAIIVAIVLVVNLLGNNFFGRIDLTGDKLYSVSPVTKQILGELDDVVMVKAYASSETKAEAGELGAFGYVPKPFQVDTLLGTVRRALAGEAPDFS